MILSANDFSPALAQHVATNAAKVGIKLELEQMADANLFTRGRSRDFEVQLVGWGAGYPDADAMISRHAVNPDNRGRRRSWRNTRSWRTSLAGTEDQRHGGGRADGARPGQADRHVPAKSRHFMLHNGPMAYIYQTIRPIAVRTEVKGFAISAVQRELRPASSCRQ